MAEKYTRSISIYINGKEVENNIKGIKSEMQQLINAQAKMTIGSKEYVEAGKNIKKLDGVLKQHRSEISSTSGVWDKVKGGIMQIGAAIGVTFGLNAIKNFALEVSKIAEEAEGVRIAFKQIASPDTLDNLRNATRGTVNDLELMRNAVIANNLGLPLESLADLFEFASRRAQQTGESVQFLVDSIVKGIGRKSPLILDNLGISATRLKENLGGAAAETASTFEYANAVAKIAQEEMVKMGDYVETTKDKQAQLTAEWDNAKIGMGNFVNQIKQAVLPALISMAKWLGEGAKSIEQIKDEVASDILKEQMIRDAAEVQQLANRFEELGIKTGKYTYEQYAALKMAEQYKAVLLSLNPEENERKSQILSQISALEKLAGIQKEIINDTPQYKNTAPAKEYKENTPSKPKELDLQDYFDKQLKAQEDFEKIKEELIVSYTEKSIDELENIEISGLRKKNDEANALIKTQKEKGLIDETEYAENKRQIEIAYEQSIIEISDYYSELRKDKDREEWNQKLANAQAYVGAVQTLLGTLSDSTMAKKTLEINHLEEEQERALKGVEAGSIKETKIKEEFEKKKLAVEKKYAQKEFNLKIAQINASTFQAIMSVWGNNTMPYPAAAAYNAIMTALISANGVLQAVAAKRERDSVKQLARGKYNVIGDEDGRLYNNVPMRGPVNGIELFNKPTLIGEHEPELAFDGEHTRKLMLSPYFRPVMALRTRQFAEGNYPENVTKNVQTTTTGIDPQLITLLMSINTLLNKLNKGIKAFISYQEIKDAEETINDIETYASGK